MSDLQTAAILSRSPVDKPGRTAQDTSKQTAAGRGILIPRLTNGPSGVKGADCRR